jgi:hypothetical protein
MAAAQKSSDDLIMNNASLDAAAVLAMRQAIYAKDGVRRADFVRLLSAGRAAGSGACPEYAELLAEAATDLLVRQVDPPGYVSVADSDWLLGQLVGGGGLSCKAEFSVLFDVLRYALSAPPALAAFAVREVEKAILTGRRAATGEADHMPGIVTAGDVEILRSLVFAATEGSSLHVTRESAEALFDIAHGALSAQNDPSFDEFFAKAVGNYLMGVAFHWTPPADEARAHEHWADRPASFADYFAKMLREPLAARFGRIGADTQTVDAMDETVFARENAADAAEIKQLGAIGANAADWVIAHLTREGPLTPAEKRLLAFLTKEATSMPPSLRAVADRA